MQTDRDESPVDCRLVTGASKPSIGAARGVTPSIGAAFTLVSSANAVTGTERGRIEPTATVIAGYTLSTENVTPHCSEHGAMNRVSATEDFWRCLTCQIGGRWARGADTPATKGE